MRNEKGNALIVAIIIIGIIAAIIYVFYLIVTTYMKTFDILFGNGWLYIVFWLLGIVLSNINIPVLKLNYKGYIYVNVGGCILPLILTYYILSRYWFLFDPLMFVIATLIMVVISKAFSRYVEGGSVIAIIFIIVFASYMVVQFLPNTIISTNNILVGKLTLGYCISTLGTLIGGDFLNIHNMKNDPKWKGKSSIGGAGTRDGVWCAGLFVMWWIIALNFLFGW